MSEDAQAGQPTDQTTNDPTNHEPDFDGDFDAERAKRAIGNLRERERKLKAQLAELAPKASELDALKASQKSDIEKLTEQLETERAQRLSLERQAIRARVALAKSLPADLADRLQGETEEELLADADKLLAIVTPQPSGVPRASSRQGAPEPKRSPGDSMNDKLRRAAGY
jgi:predicted RNase H-like nuclease (RuvC/YqgF family)